jgi:hypothetical protein
VLGAAGLQHVEIALGEALGALLVAGEERVHQAVAEGIGVDVEGRVDEVRDIGPEDLVAGLELDRGAEAFPRHLEPELAEALGRQLALLALQMHLALEAEEGDLAHHRVEHVLDLGGQQHLALDRIGGLGEQGLKGEHFAEDGRGFGQRQRGGGHQRALLGGEHLVDAVAELVGERHDIARLALVVEQHVGVGRGHGGVAEGAGRLAGAHRRVDPAAVEEAFGDPRPSRARTRHRRRAPGPWPRPTAPGGRPPRAAARCGPSGRACPCRASGP